MKNLKRDQLNDAKFNPPLFSSVNSFKREVTADPVQLKRERNINPFLFQNNGAPFVPVKETVCGRVLYQFPCRFEMAE